MDYLDFDGEQIALGLLVPESRPLTFPAYADSGQPMYTRDQKIALINDPKRMKAQTWFPNSVYIKSQGGRGSCNGYAGAKALERARVKRGLKHVPLSGEGLYAQINGQRDAGSMLDDGMKALVEKGVPPESMVPHQEYLWRNISAEARAAMPRFKALECYRVDTSDELESGLCAGFVGVIAVHANNAFNRLDGDARVSPTDGPGNHAVGVDDIRIHSNGEFEFDMFNSWGLRYGREGRGWVSWSRHLRTTSRYHAFYLIRSTNDDPQGDNPPEVAA